MINLSYNETKSILHDLNPNYVETTEWTKEYFDIDKNVYIDYSDFDLDYYLDEEDQDDWLGLEKNLENIINNFVTFLKQQHKLLYSEFSLNMIRNGFDVSPKDFMNLKKTAYS